ncbi:hypothetical protein KBZ10_04210 [Streptomyces sp. F63]|uniref:hypothetical protein n=1 Tax=Streptomyces sp. F63 TaxID=2824887 RepID=UPI001B37842E|nr:hypothetical protein [Streptomyces sp. F63]MBQ0983739.1 hypothetical protein [Streptomyces sp. F63]
MSENESTPGVPAAAPGPEPLEPPPAQADADVSAPGPVPPMPASEPAGGRAAAGPAPSLWSRLSRGTVLALGVGIGAAAMGACWLAVATVGGGESEAHSDGGGSPISKPLDDATEEETQPFTTDGALTLIDAGAGLDDGELCSGTGGYSDIDLGTQVNVTDADGTLVASGALGLGEKTETGCTFPFTVDDITPGSKFYTVEVSHRGGLTQTEDDLRAGGLEFTLGD